MGVCILFYFFLVLRYDSLILTSTRVFKCSSLMVSTCLCHVSTLVTNEKTEPTTKPIFNTLIGPLEDTETFVFYLNHLHEWIRIIRIRFGT